MEVEYIILGDYFFMKISWYIVLIMFKHWHKIDDYFYRFILLLFEELFPLS